MQSRTKPRLVWERQFPLGWIGREDSHLITLHRRGSGLVFRVDCARWGPTPEDLRPLALSAPHARTRERALALFDITQHRCATQVAVRTGRRAHTVMEWVHAYNQGGPDALAFRRTGGRRPLFAHSAKPSSARWSAPPSARPRRHRSKGPTPRRAGRCTAWSAGSASGSGRCAAARRSARLCTASSVSVVWTTPSSVRRKG